MKICSKDLRVYPQKEIGYAYRKIYNFSDSKRNSFILRLFTKPTAFQKVNSTEQKNVSTKKQTKSSTYLTILPSMKMKSVFVLTLSVLTQ